jgi:hypothetical protein
MAEVGIDEVGTEEDGPAEVGPVEGGTAEVGTEEDGPAEGGPAEVDTEEDGPTEVGPAEVGTAQVGMAEVGNSLLPPPPLIPLADPVLSAPEQPDRFVAVHVVAPSNAESRPSVSIGPGRDRAGDGAGIRGHAPSPSS